MSEIYTPGGKTPAEKAGEELSKKDPLTKEQMAELMEQVNDIDTGLRILCLEHPVENKVGRIILPDTAEALKKMGCKRFMVLKPSKDVPSIMKNTEWKLQAAQSGSTMPYELEVKELEFGDYIWAPPFGAVKIPVIITGKILTVEILNWGDVHAIQKPKSE